MSLNPFLSFKKWASTLLYPWDRLLFIIGDADKINLALKALVHDCKWGEIIATLPRLFVVAAFDISENVFLWSIFDAIS